MWVTTDTPKRGRAVVTTATVPTGQRPDEGAWAELVRIGDLKTGHEGGRAYARPIDPKWVAKLAREWDENKLDVLHVSFDPKGELVVIAGNHRLMGARVDHSPDYRMWCMVYAGLTVEEEAQKFYAIDQERKRHTLHDAHRSAKVFKDPRALAIESIFKRYNVTLAESGQHDRSKVRSIKAVYEAFEYEGPDLFEAAVRVLLDAWGATAPPNNQHTINANTIGPMVAFLWRYADLPQFRRESLIRAMQKQDQQAFGMQRYLEAMTEQRRRLQREFGGTGNIAALRLGLQVLARIYNRYVRRTPEARIPERWATLSRQAVRVEKAAYLCGQLTGDKDTDI